MPPASGGLAAKSTLEMSFGVQTRACRKARSRRARGASFPAPHFGCSLGGAKATGDCSRPAGSSQAARATELARYTPEAIKIPRFSRRFLTMHFLASCTPAQELTEIEFHHRVRRSRRFRVNSAKVRY